MDAQTAVKNAVLRNIPVTNLILDPHNPRFLHLELKGRKELSQDVMLEEISKDQQTITLQKAVLREGILNPVVVQQQKNGKYLVIDGNRRTVVIKMILDEGLKPPKGVRYDEIPARVIPATVSDVDVEVLKGVLQEGQKSWGRFNDAAFVRRLRFDYKMELEDIADRLQLSIREVRDRLRDFDLYNKYSKATGDRDPDRFSYFADAPPKVRKWFEDTEENLEQYFHLIAPGTDKHKIRSVATAGGLRDFAKILDDPEATKEFLTDAEVTVDSALEIARENNLTLAAPFLKSVGKWAAQLSTLDETQLAMIKHEPKLKLEIKRLRDSADGLLHRLEK